MRKSSRTRSMVSVKAASALSIKLNEDLLQSNEHGRAHRDHDILKGRGEEEAHQFNWQKAIFQTFYTILTPPIQAGNLWYTEHVLMWLQVSYLFIFLGVLCWNRVPLAVNFVDAVLPPLRLQRVPVGRQHVIQVNEVFVVVEYSGPRQRPDEGNRDDRGRDVHSHRDIVAVLGWRRGRSGKTCSSDIFKGKHVKVP
jgi:hypothetical protein